MSKTPTQVTAIGIFVFSALILAITMLLGFGGRAWNRQTVDFRMYYYSRVKGLSPGSPVMFRGVKVGQVTAVALYEAAAHQGYAPRGETDLRELHNDTEMAYPIQVAIEIDPRHLGYEMPWWQAFIPAFNDSVPQEIRRRINEMVMRDGLCAQLQTASLLTGQLYIDFILAPQRPDAEERALLERELSMHILPTRLAPLDKFTRQLGEKHFDSAIDNISRLTLQLSAFVESGKSQQLLDDTVAIASDIRDTTGRLKHVIKALLMLLNGSGELVTVLQRESGATATQLRSTLQRAERTLDGFDLAVGEVRGELKPLAGSLNTMLSQAQRDLDQAQALLANLSDATSQDAPLRRQLETTLQECSRAAASARDLMDRLNADPQRMLFGPPSSEEK